MVSELLLYTHTGAIIATLYLGLEFVRFSSIKTDYKMTDSRAEIKKLGNFAADYVGDEDLSYPHDLIVKLENDQIEHDIKKEYISALAKLEETIPTGPFSWHAKRSGIKFISNKLGLKM